MEQILRDIASLIGNGIVIFKNPIAVTANNASHFLTRVSSNEFWVASGINGAPDLLNQFSHPLNVLDQLTLELILGNIQVDQ